MDLLPNTSVVDIENMKKLAENNLLLIWDKLRLFDKVEVVNNWWSEFFVVERKAGDKYFKYVYFPEKNKFYSVSWNLDLVKYNWKGIGASKKISEDPISYKFLEKRTLIFDATDFDVNDFDEKKLSKLLITNIFTNKKLLDIILKQEWLLDDTISIFADGVYAKIAKNIENRYNVSIPSTRVWLANLFKETNDKKVRTSNLYLLSLILWKKELIELIEENEPENVYVDFIKYLWWYLSNQSIDITSSMKRDKRPILMDKINSWEWEFNWVFWIYKFPRKLSTYIKIMLKYYWIENNTWIEFENKKLAELLYKWEKKEIQNYLNNYRKKERMVEYEFINVLKGFKDNENVFRMWFSFDDTLTKKNRWKFAKKYNNVNKDSDQLPLTIRWIIPIFWWKIWDSEDWKIMKNKIIGFF